MIHTVKKRKRKKAKPAFQIVEHNPKPLPPANDQFEPARTKLESLRSVKISKTRFTSWATFLLTRPIYLSPFPN